MDKQSAAVRAIKYINLSETNNSYRPLMIKAVCSYFDLIKDEVLSLSIADKQFLRYLANKSGVPHYYKPMLYIDEESEENVSLQTFSNFLHKSSLIGANAFMLHQYQKEILSNFQFGQCNRYFLSGSTSFGKTFLIYEILHKMMYRNVALIFPTISLLSENLFKIYNSINYGWIKESYSIHTLSDTQLTEENNLLIFTPERYLSFVDKNPRLRLDFVFVDEVYKLDNEFIIDEIQQENERDVAYRIALHELLRNSETDALLAGPFITIEPQLEGEISSFQKFLEWYNFNSLNYNNYEIVSKEEIIIKTGRSIRVEDKFDIRFTNATKSCKFQEMLKWILDRRENVIVYCSQKHLTEKRAAELIEANIGIEIQNNERVVRLINHIERLFADNNGKQWIVTMALKRGIGIHHGLVPKYIQQEIISLFNDGILKILVCTTTITEGVNTTAKNMIILDGKKGIKPLKKFDALNIEGRAGRFMQHYKGRIFILNKEFCEVLGKRDEMLRHKLFDSKEEKTDLDIVVTEPKFLSGKQKVRRKELDKLRSSGIMPEACFDEYKTMSYDDKLYLYNTISRFSQADKNKISALISQFVGQKKLYNAGMELICQTIRPIIKNDGLRFYVENKAPNRPNCYLVDMVSAFISRGFSGSANYYIKKEGDVNKGIRKAANFVFNMLRYQVVKYLGLFNLLYKQYLATTLGKNVEDVSGIEALLLRLEYNADTPLGRKASDIGASFNVVRYYDAIDAAQNNSEFTTKLYQGLDGFEKYSVEKLNKILLD